MFCVHSAAGGSIVYRQASSHGLTAWAREQGLGQFLLVKQFSKVEGLCDCCELAHIPLSVLGRRIFVGAYTVLYTWKNEENKAGLLLNVIPTACLHLNTSRNIELFLPCGKKNELMLGQTYRADFAQGLPGQWHVLIDIWCTCWSQHWQYVL